MLMMTAVVMCFISPHSPTLCLTQASPCFTVGCRTWRCWKPPSLVLWVSTETASPLCKRPRTGVSAPLSTPDGATTRFWMSTLMLHGNYLFKKMPVKILSFHINKTKTLKVKLYTLTALLGSVWRRRLLRSLLAPMIAESTHHPCRRPFMKHNVWSWTEFLR